MLENTSHKILPPTRPGPPVLFKERVASGAPSAAAGEGEGPDADWGGRYVCAACGRAIARRFDRIGEAGARIHANPHGLVFAVIRFRAAPGCVVAGRASAQFSWYPGHLWRVALCAGCGAHLGWRFEGESLFFGLIEGAIREVEGPAG